MNETKRPYRVTKATIILPKLDYLSRTMDAFLSILQDLSPIAFNNGSPLNWKSLHSRTYRAMRGRVDATMTCNAIRTVANAYSNAVQNGAPYTSPIHYTEPYAVYSVAGSDGSASFLPNGLSIWTVDGRIKKVPFDVIEGDLSLGVKTLTIRTSEQAIIGTAILRINLESMLHKQAVSRRNKVVERYKITYDDFESMYQAQGGACAVCLQVPTSTRNRRSLHIDHDHKTGKVRKLLCQNCNRALGCVGDSVDILERLVRYLQEFE